jgi:putative methyltransferase (TIGR04325 family)
VPRALPAGYDNEAAARMHIDRMHVEELDSPALFWLQRALGDGVERVSDLGGSVGIEYSPFAQLLALSPSVRWHVVEVPAAAVLGAPFSAERGVENLTSGSDSA